MSATRREKQFITSASTLADYTSDEIPCRGYDMLSIALEIDGTGSPVGVIYAQGEEDGGGGWFNIPIDRVGYAAGVTHTPGEPDIAYDNGATDGRVAIKIASPPRKVRVFFDRTSGGDAAGITRGTYALEKWDLP